MKKHHSSEQIVAKLRQADTVEAVRRRLGHEKVSERRACKALGQPRSTQRYKPKQPEKTRLRSAAIARAEQKPGVTSQTKECCAYVF